MSRSIRFIKVENSADASSLATPIFRTPINGITDISNLLSETVLDGEQRRYVETVSTCYDVFARARKNILNLTKIEAGKLELDEIEDIRLHSLTITGSASNLGANLLRDATWKVENACTKDNLGLATDSLGLVLEKTQK